MWQDMTSLSKPVDDRHQRFWLIEDHYKTQEINENLILISFLGFSNF